MKRVWRKPQHLRKAHVYCMKIIKSRERIAKGIVLGKRGGGGEDDIKV